MSNRMGKRHPETPYLTIKKGTIYILLFYYLGLKVAINKMVI
jgi:hypothetical protein